MAIRFCAYCGYAVGEQDKFCAGCGTAIVREIPQPVIKQPVVAEEPVTATHLDGNAGEDTPPQYAMGEAVGTTSPSSAPPMTAPPIPDDVAAVPGICPYCGQAIHPQAVLCVHCGRSLSEAVTGGKKRLTAGLLGIFLGLLGVHNFYLGYTGKAVAQLLMTVLLGCLVLPAMAAAIWGLIEGILILTGQIDKDGHGRLLG